jgi:hypothetical protein
MTMDEATGDPEHVSFRGRPLWVVRVTDEQAPREGKVQSAASLSVHGLEAAGREGGLRYVEDLARWSVDEPDRLLYAGDTGIPFSDVMRRTETWIGFTNSDGWAAGDRDTDAAGGPGFQRGNGRGADLNRDLATVGWYDRSGTRGIAESEPETRAWTTLIESLPNLKTSTDIHGEITTPNDAFSDLIIPAGQWTPKRQDQVNQLSLNMIRTVERKFEEDGIVLADVLAMLPVDGATPRRPANVAASYDIVGYDDSGFMGDWFSQRRTRCTWTSRTSCPTSRPTTCTCRRRAGARRSGPRQPRGHHRGVAVHRRRRAAGRLRPGRLRRRPDPDQRPDPPSDGEPGHRRPRRRRARRRCPTTSAGSTTSPRCARPSADISGRDRRPGVTADPLEYDTLVVTTWRACRRAAPSTRPPTSRASTASPRREAAGPHRPAR